MEALANRRSSRDFDSRELPKQTLSNLLWAAWGYNRADKRTAPSSRDKQEIELYVAMKGGLYRYDAAEHRLCLVSEKDLRPLTGTQPFVADAPIKYTYAANSSSRARHPTNSSPPHTPIRDSLHRTSISSVPPNRSRQS